MSPHGHLLSPLMLLLACGGCSDRSQEGPKGANASSQVRVSPEPTPEVDVANRYSFAVMVTTHPSKTERGGSSAAVC